jgi:hypothetical protein
MATKNMYRLPKSKWLVQHPKIKGVFVGGCINNSIHPLPYEAHVHRGKTIYDGWICFRTNKLLHVKELWLHELAHLIASAGHTNNWRRILLEIGGTLSCVYDNNILVMESYYNRKYKPPVDYLIVIDGIIINNGLAQIYKKELALWWGIPVLNRLMKAQIYKKELALSSRAIYKKHARRIQAA